MKNVFLILFGGIFIIVGILVGTLASGSARKEAERVTNLASLTARTLQDQPDNADVVVEGQVSPSNRTIFRDFVAYIGEEYRGRRDNRDRWDVFERKLPRLQIETADGVVRFANEHYQFAGPLHHWQESSGLNWNGFTGSGTKRYEGLYVGDVVTLIGTAKLGNEEVEVQVSKVFKGTRLEYIEDQQAMAGWLPWFGAIFAGAGLLVSGIGVVMFIRR